MRKAARQGDVLMWPVDKARGQRLPTRKGNVHIVAEGERSGHNHTISGGSGSMFLNEEGLSVSTSGPMTHPEHDAAALDGDYDVVQQRRATGGEFARPQYAFD